MIVIDGIDVQIDGAPLHAFGADGVTRIVTDIKGWGATKPTGQPVQKPRQSGAWMGYSYSGARVMTVTGLLDGPSAASVETAFDDIVASFPLGDAVLSVTEGGMTRYVTVRRTDEVVPTRLSPTAIQWSVIVTAVDWRKFGAVLSGTTRLPSSTGGVTFPLTFPLAFTATTVNGQVALTNPGNEVGPVRLRIDGPCQGPVITHISSGAQLVFASSLSLGAGEWLDVDMDARSVLANGQSSRNGSLTSRGWSAFDPGVNVWAFTASSFSSSALLTVYATPAWL